MIDYLPWFRMWDPWVTREITVRDLLVHRSGLGLGQGDLLYWPESNVTRREIVEAVRHLEPATSFRSAYAYDNILYHAAALVIEEVSGLTWEEFVQARIIAPLGMNDTRVTRASTLEEGNVATPHARVEGDGTARAAARGDGDQRGRRNQLDRGRHGEVADRTAGFRPGDGNDRLFSERTTRQLWGPVTPMPIGRWPDALSPLQPQFAGLRPGLRDPGLPGAQDGDPHRRPAGLRVAGHDDPGPEAGNRGPDEPGDGRRVRVDHGTAFSITTWRQSPRTGSRLRALRARGIRWWRSGIGGGR